LNPKLEKKRDIRLIALSSLLPAFVTPGGRRHVLKERMRKQAMVSYCVSLSGILFDLPILHASSTSYDG
jgi:hypothetical protein